MNENSQRVNQIMEALKLTESGNNPMYPAQGPVLYTIAGDARKRLIDELVNLLAPVPTT